MHMESDTHPMPFPSVARTHGNWQHPSLFPANNHFVLCQEGKGETGLGVA
jgi:hypothetical protein